MFSKNRMMIEKLNVDIDISEIPSIKLARLIYIKGKGILSTQTTVMDEFIGSAETYCEHPEIGYFHPIQKYYFGELIESIKEPIETDHVLEWVPYEEIKNNMFLKMQSWAIDECWKKMR